MYSMKILNFLKIEWLKYSIYFKSITVIFRSNISLLNKLHSFQNQTLGQQ